MAPSSNYQGLLPLSCLPLVGLAQAFGFWLRVCSFESTKNFCVPLLREEHFQHGELETSWILVGLTACAGNWVHAEPH